MRTDRKTIVTSCHLPDGFVVDVDAGHIYWINMGIPNLNGGSTDRVDIDGKNRKTIVAQGDTHTQNRSSSIRTAARSCDREDVRVSRCNLDGLAWRR